MEVHIFSEQVNLALDEILQLREKGPSIDDVLIILEIEQRAHENGLQENYYWLERILRSYQSRLYSGDVSGSFEIKYTVLFYLSLEATVSSWYW
ncbi:zinc protease PQQL-like [Primulina eburnea]|uniref:zinc protease PQQL-like n=1 Tax=Primulina eburnea TaxID=1245227 RepID=UPI003C6C9CAF